MACQRRNPALQNTGNVILGSLDSNFSLTRKLMPWALGLPEQALDFSVIFGKLCWNTSGYVLAAFLKNILISVFSYFAFFLPSFLWWSFSFLHFCREIKTNTASSSRVFCGEVISVGWTIWGAEKECWELTWILWWPGAMSSGSI